VNNWPESVRSGDYAYERMFAASSDPRRIG